METLTKAQERELEAKTSEVLKRLRVAPFKARCIAAVELGFVRADSERVPRPKKESHTLRAA